MNAKLKWNFVVEKVKEEKYNMGQKCSHCSNQIKEKSENIGATVKMQANAVMTESAIKAKEAEVILKEKSNKIKEKSQLAGESMKEKSSIVGGAIRSKSLNAGETMKLHTISAGNNIKTRSAHAGEIIKGKTHHAIETVKANINHPERIETDVSNEKDDRAIKTNKSTEKSFSSNKNANEQKEVQGTTHPDNLAKSNISSSKLLQKSQEILRKQTKKAGQIFKESFGDVHLLNYSYHDILFKYPWSLF